MLPLSQAKKQMGKIMSLHVKQRLKLPEYNQFFQPLKQGGTFF